MFMWYTVKFEEAAIAIGKNPFLILTTTSTKWNERQATMNIKMILKGKCEDKLIL